MDKHHGRIVEHCVRKNEYSISDLAKCINTNRRSIYNWFNQKYLKSDIIYRIGCVINHDFSEEFPEMFSVGEFKTIPQINDSYLPLNNPVDEGDVWKNKYIELLEKYNSMLEIQLKFPYENG